MADPTSIPSVGPGGNANLGPAMQGADVFKAMDYLNYVKPATQTDPYWQKYFQDQLKAGRNPTQLNTQNQDQSRAQQQAFIQQLHRLAQGDPNSLAQQQLRQSTQMAQGQVGGGLAARSNLGGAGATMRQAGAVQGSLGRQGMDQSRVLQMQEQAAAQQALAQAYAAQHGQDVGLANTLAQLNLGNTALDDRNRQFNIGTGLGYDMGNWQRNMDLKRAALGFDLEGRAIDQRNARDWMGVGASALGTFAQMGSSKPRTSQQSIDDAFNGG